MPFLANPALQSIRSDVFSLFFAVVLVVFGAVVALFGAVVLGWSVGVNRIRPALKLGKSFFPKNRFSKLPRFTKLFSAPKLLRPVGVPVFSMSRRRTILVCPTVDCSQRINRRNGLFFRLAGLFIKL